MDENGAQEQPDANILGALPRTRPQRSSPRRASAKARHDTQPSAAPSASSAAPSASTTRARKQPRKTAKAAQTAKTPPPRRREPPAPAQGWEAQEEPKTGVTVHPPNGVELVESVATIFAELASAVLKGGSRVLKDALSPLRKP